MAHPTKFQFSFLLLLLLCSTTTFVVNKCNALSIRMIHRDSPESPVYRPNLTEIDRMRELIQMSHARIHSLAKQVKSRSSANATSSSSLHPNDVIFRAEMSLQDWLYIVKLGLGKFDPSSNSFQFQTIYLALDTGSDLSWTQCEGCDPCFHQTYPYYPASKSKTYKVVSCSYCPADSQCQDNVCKFVRTYGDGSSVTAIAATETFGFQTDKGEYIGVTNVGFGCGVSMKNFNTYGIQPQNQISGLMGMSYGSMSFVRQALQFTKGRFSYCLQKASTGGSSPSPMLLRFGDDIIEKPGMQVTPMPVQSHPLYYLNLVGITVSKKRLEIDPQVFKLRPDGSGGCAIDSGAGASFLVTDAYKIFADEVVNHVLSKNKNLRKMENPERGFQLCFERIAEPSRIWLPWVRFHFENDAVFVVKQSEVFWIGNTAKGTGMICSTIFESTDKYNWVTLLGAKQQVNQRIIYDTEKQQLMFTADDCSQGN